MRSHGTWVVAMAAAMALSGCGGDRPETADGGKVRVVASIFPLADVARQIGGEHVEVSCLLRPGLTPHDYRATLGDAATVGRARLCLRVGLGLDDWFPPEAKNVLLLGYAVGVAPPATSAEPHPPGEHAEEGEGGEDEEEHHHGGIDPHVWLDPAMMQTFVSKLADDLARLDPAHQQDYFQRRDEYLAKLRQLDEDYRRTLAGVKIKQFVTFHAAFTYVARRYGLQQESLHTSMASAPGVGRMKEVTDFIRAHGVKVVFAEPQFPAENLEALAKEAGVKVGRLDPEGNPDVRGYDSYLAMMRSNLAALSEAMKE